MKMNHYVMEKKEIYDRYPLVNNPFGMETDGDILSGWTQNYRRAYFFLKDKGISEFAEDNMIQIYVPATGSGIEPCNIHEQPYGWKGKINESVAERAVWWAFDLLTEDEANDFFRDEHPVVKFEYLGLKKISSLTVIYNGSTWIVQSEN